MSALQLARRVPPIVLLIVLAACAGERRPGEARIPDGAWISHRAVFIGESNHDTVGTVSLYQSEEYPVVVFEPNFRINRAPNTVVALGSDGYAPDTVLGQLLKPAGQQAYAVPPKLDLNRYNEVWLWSRNADLPVGLARLTPL